MTRGRRTKIVMNRTDRSQWLHVAGRVQCRADNVISWFLVLAIAGYPLVASIPAALEIPSRTVSIPLRASVVGLSLAVVWKVLKGRSPRLTQPVIWLAIMVFWTTYGMRFLHDAVLTNSARALSAQEYAGYIFGVCCFPFLASLVGYDSRTLEKTLWRLIFVVGAAIAAVWALYITGHVASPKEWLIHGRLGLEDLNPISLGQLGVTASVLCVSVIGRGRTRRVSRIAVLSTLMLLGLLTLAATASRGPILSLVAVVSVVSLAKGLQRRRLVTRIVLGLIVVVGSVGGVALAEHLDFRPVNRVASLAHPGSDQDVVGRWVLATRAGREFLESPVLGSGLEERESHFYPHDVVVESFMATGMVGGTAFCALLICGLVAAVRLVAESSPAGWVGVLFVQYLVAALVSGALYMSGTMWVLLGAVLSCRYTRYGTVGAVTYHAWTLPRLTRRDSAMGLRP